MMEVRTSERDKRTKMLSQQLDQQIEKIKSDKLTNENTQITSMTPFQLLEQKLRRLQEKLEKVNESDSRHVIKPRKNSSSNNSKISTNRNFYQEKNQRSPQQNLGKKKSFTIEKDHQVESHLISNSRKIFKSDKKYRQEEQQNPKKKKERIVSGKILSNKSSNKNSKMNTPQKKKRAVVSAKNTKVSNNVIDQNNFSTKKINKEQEFQTKSKKKKVTSSSKKQKQVIDSEYESEFKFISKNLNNSESISKLKKKSLTSMSQNQVFLSSLKNEEKNDKNFTTFRIEQGSSKKKKYLSNLEEKVLKKHFSYNNVHQNLINFSRQPMIPLKQKIYIEKQLKQKSRQNLKLKQQLGKLHKYEQEYWKMKEIFEKFEKERKFHKNKK